MDMVLSSPRLLLNSGVSSALHFATANPAAEAEPEPEPEADPNAAHPAADDDGLVPQRWVVPLFDRGIKGVAVDMGDGELE